ncbi:MAG: hypothetical protein Q8N49_01140 [Candidatus Omnitrophota bacterium]|nr:hypothetical protein [Candidatus Omnitrophota bacterium]
MNTKDKIFVSILLVLTVVGGLSKEVRGSEELFNLVPDKAIIVAYIDANKQDPGLSYQLRLWKDKLDRRGEYRKREQIKEIYDRLGHVEAVGAIFIDQKGTLQHIVIVKIVGKNDDKEGQFNIFQEDIKRLIKKKEELRALSYLEYKIIYSVDRYPSEVSAYVCIDDDIIAVGTNAEVLKEIIRVKKRRVDSLAGDKKFIDMKSRFAKGSDGFIYIDNKDGRFIKLLREWEQKHYMTLLLSGDFLEAIGIFFDIVDEDISKGRIVLFTHQENALFDDIQDDTRFFDEVIRRKFMAEGVKYTSEITINSQYAILDFKITGLEPFWTKVFGEERKEIIKGNENNIK